MWSAMVPAPLRRYDGVGRRTIEKKSKLLLIADEVHQFKNIADEPLGFLCIIPSREQSA